MDENLDEFFSNNGSPITETDDITITDTVETVEEVTQPEPETVEAIEPDVEATVAETDDRKNWVPVGALTAERAKAKTAREEAEALRQRVAQYEAQSAASQTVPDAYDDPTAYHAHLTQQNEAMLEQRIALYHLTQSRIRAVEKHGEEEVASVAEWAASQANIDPTFESRVFAQADPVEWVIAQKKRHELVTQFEADPDAFVMERARQLGLAAAPMGIPAQSTPATKSPVAPLSLNNAKSRDTAESIHPKSAEENFDAIFKK